MKLPTFLPFACVLALAACASPHEPTRYAAAGSTHWEKAYATQADFSMDNETCGAAASRKVPVGPANQPPAAMVPPENRMDAPPRISANPVYDHEYMSCMSQHGWQVVSRQRSITQRHSCTYATPSTAWKPRSSSDASPSATRLGE